MTGHNSPKQKIDWLQGKPATTRFKVEKRWQNKTRITLFPLTGRTHQLRLHMLQIGHPILGDNFYSMGNSQNESPRLQLHADSLEFEHPMSRETITLSSPAPF